MQGSQTASVLQGPARLDTAADGREWEIVASGGRRCYIFEVVNTWDLGVEGAAQHSRAVIQTVLRP